MCEICTVIAHDTKLSFIIEVVFFYHYVFLFFESSEKLRRKELDHDEFRTDGLVFEDVLAGRTKMKNNHVL